MFILASVALLICVFAALLFRKFVIKNEPLTAKEKKVIEIYGYVPRAKK